MPKKKKRNINLRSRVVIKRGFLVVTNRSGIEEPCVMDLRWSGVDLLNPHLIRTAVGLRVNCCLGQLLDMTNKQHVLSLSFPSD